MATVNFDQVSIGDRLKVTLADTNFARRGPAGTVVDGYVIEKDEDRRVVVLDTFLVGVEEADEIVEHVRIAQATRPGAIDQVGDS